MEDRPCIRLYVEHLYSLTKLTPSARNVLLGIVHYLEEDNTVDLSSYRRKVILHSLNISKQTFSAGLNELKSSGIIAELDINFYEIDPMYLTKNV